MSVLMVNIKRLFRSVGVFAFSASAHNLLAFALTSEGVLLL